MKKLSEILQLTELFYKKALRLFAAESWTMPDDEEDTSAGLTGNITVDAEKFDIKDENLFNQFELFMDTYNELVDSLSTDAENLDPESLQDIAGLNKTFETRYERLVTNPYLNDMDHYDESFEPGEFTSFIQNVFADVENRFSNLSKADLSMEEIMQANLPEEFNTQQELAGNSAAEKWSAERVFAAMQARKTWAEGIAEAKKFGPAHSKWESYQKFVATRKRNYAAMMADPSRRKHYLERCRVRFNDWFTNVKQQKAQLEQLLATTSDPKKREEISAKLAKYNSSLEKHLSRQKRYTDKRKNLKDSKSLAGLNLTFKQITQTAKSDIKKRIILQLEQLPQLLELKKKIAARIIINANDPSPANINELERLKKLDKDLKTSLVEENEDFKVVQSQIDELENFRKEVDKLEKNPAEAASIPTLVSVGEGLVKKYEKLPYYKQTIKNLVMVIEKLKS